MGAVFGTQPPNLELRKVCLTVGLTTYDSRTDAMKFEDHEVRNTAGYFEAASQVVCRVNAHEWTTGTKRRVNAKPAKSGATWGGSEQLVEDCTSHISCVRMQYRQESVQCQRTD